MQRQRYIYKVRTLVINFFIFFIFFGFVRFEKVFQFPFLSRVWRWWSFFFIFNFGFRFRFRSFFRYFGFFTKTESKIQSLFGGFFGFFDIFCSFLQLRRRFPGCSDGSNTRNSDPLPPFFATYLLGKPIHCASNSYLLKIFKATKSSKW